MLPAAILLLSFLAHAQVGVGVQVDPGNFSGSKEGKAKEKPKVLPFVEALLQTMSPEELISLSVSTSSVKEDWSRLMLRGVYKQEMLQLILLAQKAKKPLKDVLKQRAKKQELSKMAGGFGLSYDAIYEESLGWRKKIDTLLTKSTGG